MKVEFRLNKYKDAAELLRTEEFHEQFVVDFVMKADIVTVASGERFSVKLRELVVVGPTGRPEVKLYGDWV